MYDQTTVKEYLFGQHHCSESLLEQLAEDALFKMESNYWYRVRDFVRGNSYVLVSKLSPSEKSWLDKIRDDLLMEAHR